MKESIKLIIALLEKTECILTKTKDKESINSLIDNMWRLINKSRLQPTHKQKITSVIMNLRQDRGRGRYLELDSVLNPSRIITVFSCEDERQEEFVAMLSSAEQSDSRSGYRQKECSPSKRASSRRGPGHWQWPGPATSE
jgi:hypothetical protein